MSQYGFYFDQTRCLSCKACQVGCKIWNEEKRGDAAFNAVLNWLPNQDVNEKEVTKYANPKEYEDLPGSTGVQNHAEYGKYHMKENWRRVTTTEYGDVLPNVDTLSMSVSCNHCADPACVKVCPMGNIYKESQFGAVLAGSSCISCGRCLSACPWDAPQFYDSNYATYAQSDPKRPKITKCTMCYERISIGRRPACVSACSGRALKFGPMDELKRDYPGYALTAPGFASDELLPGTKTNPSIIFKVRNLHIKV